MCGYRQNRQTAIDNEATARADGDTAEATARATAIDQEVIDRNAAILVETNNRVAAVDAETTARVSAVGKLGFMAVAEVEGVLTVGSRPFCFGMVNQSEEGMVYSFLLVVIF